MIVIFDFDGTIADSFDYVAGFLESQLRRHNPLTEADKVALRGLPMIVMARRLGCPTWRLPLLYLRGRHAMGKVIYNVPLFSGIAKVLEELQAEGHELFIVSSNNNRNIKKFLKQHHLYKYITAIYGGAGFFGKERTIRKLLRRNGGVAASSWYIGDETRDVIAAQAVGVRCIAVLWGFAGPGLLAALRPTALAAAPQDIVRILEEA